VSESPSKAAESSVGGNSASLCALRLQDGGVIHRLHDFHEIRVRDDQPEACEAVKQVLEYYGAVVRTAASGSEALDLLPDMKPDVLVADLAMPEIDGYHLIKQVRRLSAGLDLPAVALTALVGPAREAALGAGYEMFESKPILAGELVSLVARLADSSRAI